MLEKLCEIDAEPRVTEDAETIHRSSEPAIVFQLAREANEAPLVTRPAAVSILLCSDADAGSSRSAVQEGFSGAASYDADAGALATFIQFARQLLERDTELATALEKLQTTNENMAHASRRFEELFHGLPVACFTVSSDGIIHDWNKESEEAFGITSSEAFMQPIEALLGDASHGIWSQMTLNEVLQYGDLQRIQWTFTGENGIDKTFMGTLYPSVGRDGKISGMISANIDITDRVSAQRQIHDQMIQLESMNGQLARLSVTDGLTGLYNHRHFQETLTSAIEACGSRPASLILLDVDHFKKYNDSFGHVAGDAVLKKVAAILTDLFQEPDLAARYGGEEFAVVLPGHSESEALKRAEALRAAIEGADWTERPVTASLGVTTTNNAKLPAKDMIRQADEALYKSKEAGRNRATLFSPNSQTQAA